MLIVRILCGLLAIYWFVIAVLFCFGWFTPESITVGTAMFTTSMFFVLSALSND